MKMDAIVKIGTAAVMASCACLLLKKTNPEMGVPMALLVCAATFAVAAGFLAPIMKFLNEARELSGLSDALFYPVVKSVGIGICAKLSGEMCKDSGQAAMAGGIEILGAVCALYTALPLMQTLLDMLEDML